MNPTPRYVRTLWVLIDYLYADDGLRKFSGGPLHIVVDDYNTEDSSLEFCRNDGVNYCDDDNPAVRPLCLAILDLLEPLSEADRYGVVRGPLNERWPMCSEQDHQERRAVGYCTRRTSSSGGYDAQICAECCERVRTDPEFAFDDEPFTAFDVEGRRIA